MSAATRELLPLLTEDQKSIHDDWLPKHLACKAKEGHADQPPKPELPDLFDWFDGGNNPVTGNPCVGEAGICIKHGSEHLQLEWPSNACAAEETKKNLWF